VRRAARPLLALALGRHVFAPRAPLVASSGGGGLLPPPRPAPPISRNAYDRMIRRRGPCSARSRVRRRGWRGAGRAGKRGPGGLLLDAGALSPRLVRGAGLLEGSAFGDSARFAIGGVFRSDEIEFSPAWARTDENLAAPPPVPDRSAENNPSRSCYPGIVLRVRPADWRIASGQRLGVTPLSKPADQPAAVFARRHPASRGPDLSPASPCSPSWAAGNQLRLWASSTRESFETHPWPSASWCWASCAQRQRGARFEESTIRCSMPCTSAPVTTLEFGGDCPGHARLAWRRGAVAEVLFGGHPAATKNGVFRKTRGARRQSTGTPDLRPSSRTRYASRAGITAVARVERHGLDSPARDPEVPPDRPANDPAPSESWRISPRLTLPGRREFRSSRSTRPRTNR
jgi:hypothetical protein